MAGERVLDDLAKQMQALGYREFRSHLTRDGFESRMFQRRVDDVAPWESVCATNNALYFNVHVYGLMSPRDASWSLELQAEVPDSSAEWVDFKFYGMRVVEEATLRDMERRLRLAWAAVQKGAKL